MAIDKLASKAYTKTNMAGPATIPQKGVLMKRASTAVIVLGACAALALLAPARAHCQQGHWYLKGDFGGNWTQDTDVKDWFFNEQVQPGSKMKFNPGVRFGIAGGFFITDWWSTEFETGVMANDVDFISAETGANVPSHVDATFENVPFLVNFRFQCPRWDLLSPYFGGGVGGAVTILDADHIDRGFGGESGTATDGVFAYQAFGGLRYKLNEQMGLSLEYRYFGTESPNLEADFTPGRIKLGGAATHSVSLAFDWKF